MQQSEEKVRERLLLAALPAAGHENRKQMVSVCVPLCNATNPEAGQKTYSWGLWATGKGRWGAMRFNSASV